MAGRFPSASRLASIIFCAVAPDGAEVPTPLTPVSPALFPHEAQPEQDRLAGFELLVKPRPLLP